MSTEVKRKIVEEVQKLAEEFQDDCHHCVKEIMKNNTHISYQDATNIWTFTKLAELQQQINKLIKPPPMTETIEVYENNNLNWVRGAKRLPGLFTTVKWRNADGGNIPLPDATPLEHYKRAGANINWHEWLDESPSGSEAWVRQKVLDVIDTVKAQYPTSVFPENGTSPDSKAAMMARLICDNIKREMEIMFNEEPAPSSTPQSVEERDWQNKTDMLHDQLLQWTKNCNETQSQLLQAQKECEYWKARCEAAEGYISILGNGMKYSPKVINEQFETWQALKQQPIK